MKQFIILAYDAKDDGAPQRRMAAREAHLATIAKLRASGNMLIGMALTDDDDKMIGSVIAANFPSRAELNAWLKVEPYATQKVWKDITILSAKLAPTFADLIKKAS